LSANLTLPDYVRVARQEFLKSIHTSRLTGTDPHIPISITSGLPGNRESSENSVRLLTFKWNMIFSPDRRITPHERVYKLLDQSSLRSTRACTRRCHRSGVFL
jgi:hypothetical protein